MGWGIGTQKKVGAVGRRKQRCLDGKQSVAVLQYQVPCDASDHPVGCTSYFTQNKAQSRKEISSKLKVYNIVTKNILVWFFFLEVFITDSNLSDK